MCRCNDEKCSSNHRRLNIEKQDKKALGVRSVDAWSGLFGMRTGDGKLTLGIRFPVKANPDGSPVKVITGINEETGLNTWDYDSEDIRDKFRVEAMVREARADRKAERKSKALAKARAATIKGRRMRAATGTMTIHDRVEIVRTLDRIEKL